MREDQGERFGEMKLQNERRLEAYRDVANEVAHDLNNLLLLISGYTEMLSKNLDNRELILEVIRKIQAATSSVRDLTKKLQAIAQVDDDEPITEAPSTPLSLAEKGVPPESVTIAIVVRDKELRQLVSRILKRSGFKAYEISIDDIEVPSEIIAGESVDVVVTDVEPRQKIGDDFLRDMLLVFVKARLLFLTTTDIEEVPSTIVQICSSLSRTFLPSELVDAVHRLLM